MRGKHEQFFTTMAFLSQLPLTFYTAQFVVKAPAICLVKRCGSVQEVSGLIVTLPKHLMCRALLVLSRQTLDGIKVYSMK